MNEQDEAAFEAWLEANNFGPSWVMAENAWQAALEYARGQQEPVGHILIDTGDFEHGTKEYHLDGNWEPVYTAPPAEPNEDHKRLVRELDVLINGEAGAAKQASLCDIVSQVEKQGLVANPPAEVVRQLVQCAEDAIQFIGGLPVEVTGYRGGYALKSDLAPSVRLIGNLKSALVAAKEAGL